MKLVRKAQTNTNTEIFLVKKRFSFVGLVWQNIVCTVEVGYFREHACLTNTAFSCTKKPQEEKNSGQWNSGQLASKNSLNQISNDKQVQSLLAMQSQHRDQHNALSPSSIPF